MTLIRWSSLYSVGVEEIDMQHKHLVKVLNELFDAMVSGDSAKVLHKIVEELYEYTVFHFQTERRYFETYNYPDKDAHIEEHQSFVKKVDVFKKEMQEGKLTLTTEILTYLQTWLKDHISGVDQEYAQFFKDQGITE